MAVERTPNVFVELMDLLDRILDKGLVFDAAERISLVGVGPIDSSNRTHITSCETVSEEQPAVNGNLRKPKSTT